jgi:hypothetical protein
MTDPHRLVDKLYVKSPTHAAPLRLPESWLS